MRTPQPHSRDPRAGFTLLEMIVSMAIIVSVMLIVVHAMARVQDTWVTTNAKVREAQDARTGMETLSRTIPRATLDPQWVMEDSSDPKFLQLSSELHFVSGPAAVLLPLSADITGHAIFFQAPNGYAGADERSTTTPTSAKAEYDTLPNVLNAWGYFVQFGEDPAKLPGFLNSMNLGRSPVPKQYRFRLMEFRQPAHELELFKMNPGDSSVSMLSKITSQDELYKWFSTPVAEPMKSDKTRCTVVADNILAMVILPLRQGDSAGAAATGEVVPGAVEDYLYDSRRHQWDADSTRTALSRHHLPAAVQISLIVLDERDWSKLLDNEAYGTGSELRSQVVGKFARPGNFASDMGSLTGELNRRKMRHRVITTTLQIPGGIGATMQEAK